MPSFPPKKYAPDCISVHIHFKKFLGGMPLDPPRKLVAFSHSGLLPQTINRRQNPDTLLVFLISKPHWVMGLSLCTGGFGGARRRLRWEEGQRRCKVFEFQGQKKCSIFLHWGTKDESLSAQIHSLSEIYFHSKQ